MPMTNTARSLPPALEQAKRQLKALAPLDRDDPFRRPTCRLFELCATCADEAVLADDGSGRMVCGRCAVVA